MKSEPRKNPPHPKTGHPRSKSRSLGGFFSSLSRKTAIGLAIVAVLLIALRIALPHVILRVANQKLNEIPEYRGHIEDVDLSLWRGAYQIEGVRLDKLNGKIPVPFFSARVVDLSVEWRALFHGKLVSEIEVYEPRVNFVNAPTKEESQTEIDDSWRDKVDEMFPLRINHFAIHEGEVHFRDFHRQPKVDIHLDHLEVNAKGLSNRQEKGKALPAVVHAGGRAMDHAKIRLDIKLAPLAKQPTFDLNAELTGLKLATLNDFLRAYASVDMENGRFDLFTEMAGADGKFTGYVKPLAKNVEILDLEKDKGNPLQVLWEALVAGVEKVLENPPKSQVGTQIPISGTFSDPKAGIWPTIGALLRNAFIRALRPQLNNSVDIQDVPKKPEPPKTAPSGKNSKAKK